MLMVLYMQTVFPHFVYTYIYGSAAGVKAVTQSFFSHKKNSDSVQIFFRHIKSLSKYKTSTLQLIEIGAQAEKLHFVN